MGSPTLYRQASDGMKVELIEWLNAAKINKKCYYLDKAIKLTFPVKCGLQAASLGKGHATSTNRAKGLGYREEFYDDVQDNHQEKQQTRQPKQQSK
jgi:hypothetical protein